MKKEKTYKLTISEIDGIVNMYYEKTDFTLIEIIGFLEMVKSEILKFLTDGSVKKDKTP